MKNSQYRDFYEAANFLKKHVPCNKRINIRRVLVGELDGSCELKNDRFLIKINKKLSVEHSIDVLLHEIAHAHAWGKDKDHHGPNWGMTYAYIYRFYHEHFTEAN